MPNYKLFLVYKEIKRPTRIPKSFLELKDNFLTIFNEDKNKKFSFSYLSNLIDENTDFVKLVKIFKENPEKSKNIININEIDKNQLINNNQKIDNNKLIKNNIINTDKSEFQNNLLSSKDLNNTSDDDSKFSSNPETIKFYKDIKLISSDYHEKSNKEYSNTLDYEIIIFNSVYDILYLICSGGEDNNSIISYNLIDEKKMIELKDVHSKMIINFRHYFDKLNARDLVMSLSVNCQLIIIDVNNWEIIFDLNNIKVNSVCSSCFLNNFNLINIVICYGNWDRIFGSNSFNGFIKIYNLKAKELKSIKNSHIAYTIDSFYDKISSKNYLIVGNEGHITSYNSLNWREYYSYNDKDTYNFLYRPIIFEKDRVTKLIESTINGEIRIWDFNKRCILSKIKIGKEYGVGGICLWNDNYLFVAGRNKAVNLVDLDKNKIINQFKHYHGVSIVKKVYHPKYGECLISKETHDKSHKHFGLMKLWINKN